MTTVDLGADARARELARTELARIFHDGDCGCGAGDDAELAPYFQIVDMLLDSSKIRTYIKDDYIGTMDVHRTMERAAGPSNIEWKSLILEITPDK